VHASPLRDSDELRDLAAGMRPAPDLPPLDCAGVRLRGGVAGSASVGRRYKLAEGPRGAGCKTDGRVVASVEPEQVANDEPLAAKAFHRDRAGLVL